MTPRILFVDDERSILAGIRRLLRRRAQAWEIHLADSAADALDLMAGTPIDVLVTDVRMPGTDSVTLLEQVRTRYPATARLVLSGHADTDSIVRAAGPAQQFLSKPCEPHHLERALERALNAVALMDDQPLRELFGAQTVLPKPSSLYTQLTELVATPGAKVERIAELVERDVATTAEVLKLVNSSFFGLTSDVTTVDRAVTLLGIDVIASLVLAGSLFTTRHGVPSDLDATLLAERGTAASLLVRRIGHVEQWEPETTSQLALAAILRDVGLLVLATHDPHAWRTYLDGPPDLPAAPRQDQAFGCTVGRASAYLLGLWGFNPLVVTTLANQPLDLDDPDTVAAATPAELVVAYTHHHVEGHHLPTITTTTYLDAARLQRWSADDLGRDEARRSL